MAWITITEDDVLTVISSPKLEGIRAAALADDQDDPVQPAIDQVTNQVRGYLGRRYNLGAAGTISDKVLGAALDIIAVRIPQRVDQDASKGREDLKDDAIRYLEQIAEGKIDIEEPLIADTETSGSQSRVEIVSYRDRIAKGSDLNGL